MITKCPVARAMLKEMLACRRVAKWDKSDGGLDFCGVYRFALKDAIRAAREAEETSRALGLLEKRAHHEAALLAQQKEKK